MATLVDIVAVQHKRPAGTRSRCGCGEYVLADDYAKHIVQAALNILMTEVACGRWLIDHDIALLNSTKGLSRHKVQMMIDDLLDRRPFEELFELVIREGEEGSDSAVATAAPVAVERLTTEEAWRRAYTIARQYGYPTIWQVRKGVLEGEIEAWEGWVQVLDSYMYLLGEKPVTACCVRCLEDRLEGEEH